MGLLGEFFSWFGFLLLVTGAVVGGGLYFLHTRFDEAVRNHVEARLRAAYPKHRIALRAARRLEGQGIELRGLTIAEIGENGVAAPLLSVGELLLQCNASTEDLMAGKLDAKQLVLSHLKINATRNANGQWNLATLFPLPSFGSQQLPISIENSSAEIILESGNSAVPVTAEIRQVTLTPIANPDGAAPARVWQFAGTLGGSQLQQVDVQGSYDLSTNQWRAEGAVRGFKISPELVEFAPPEYHEHAMWLRGLQASINARYEITNVGATEWPVRFKISEGELIGRFEDPRLPVPLTDLKASFVSNGQSLEIPKASARLGQATLNLACNIHSFREDSPCSLKLNAQQLQFDRQFVDTLPETWREQWNMLAPDGKVDVDVELAFDGQQVTKHAFIDCHNVSFAYYKFPYRLMNGHGRIEWRNDELTFDGFRAYANGRDVLINGTVRNPGPDFDGYVSVKVDATNPVPIDEKLIAAVPESARNFIQRLNTVGGFVTLDARFERHQGDPPVLHRKLTVGIKDCAVNYDLFPYPLSRINGKVEMVDGQWRVLDGGLTGINDSAWIECNGAWGPDESGVMQVALDFIAQDVPLSEELHDALKPEVQSVWDSIRPSRGTVDQIRAGVRYDGQTKKTAVDFTAIKNRATGNVKERSISVKPVWLPYKLDDVEGTLECKNGVVELKNVSGHGRESDTVVQLSGLVEQTPDGLWEVKLESLNVDRARITPQLAAALPPRLGNAVTKLNISGPFDMTGKMTLAGRKGETVPKSTQWDLEFDIEDGSVDCGVRLEHLHGGLRLTGGLDERGLVSRGNLEFDSLIYKGIQFTQVAGPISLDDERVGFGEWSTTLPEEGSHQPIRAHVFGGTAQGSGEVKLSGDFPFSLEGHLQNGNLAMISREATSRRHDISGLTFAEVYLKGNRLGSHTLQGNGTVQLRQADIYRLPLMARLLKVLTISPPNATAFTASDIAYHIEGDRVYFDNIVFEGDAISLNGKGEMTLDGSIQLAFYTTVGRTEFSEFILRPLLKEAGKNLIEITVTGTVADPQFKKQLAPELNNTLQTLFPGQQPANRPSNMTRLPSVLDRLTPK